MNPHFVEILKAFRDEGVEHLVIGAHALAAHGHVRATFGDVVTPVLGLDETGDLAAISVSALDVYKGLTCDLATNSSNAVDRTFGPGFWLSTYTTDGQRFGFDQNT